jgi:hypothetical protein
MKYKYLSSINRWQNGDERRWVTGSDDWQKVPSYSIGFHVDNAWTAHKDARRPIRTKVGAQRRVVGRKRPVVLDNGGRTRLTAVRRRNRLSDNSRSRKAVAKRK